MEAPHWLPWEIPPRHLPFPATYCRLKKKNNSDFLLCSSAPGRGEKYLLGQLFLHENVDAAQGWGVLAGSAVLQRPLTEREN